MKLLYVWFTVSRPLLYPLLPIIAILGYQAAGGNVWEAPYDFWLLTLLLTWPLSMIVYGLNDISDIVSDGQNNYRQTIAGQTVKVNEIKLVKIGVLAAFALVVGSLFWLPTVTFILLLALCLGACVYSLPPFRLKEKIFVDMFFSGAMYIVLPYLIGMSMLGSYTLPTHIIMLAVLASAYHLLAAVRDIEADSKAGYTTTAIKFGKLKSLILILSLLAAIFSYWLWFRSADIIGQLYILFFIIVILLNIKVDNAKLVEYSVNLMALGSLIVGLVKVFF